MTSITPTAHLVYDDTTSVAELGSDALRCGIRLRRAVARGPLGAPPLVAVAPSKASGELSVSVAAQRLANALHLHLD